MVPRDPELKADAIERAGNVASIQSVPLSILPAGEARDALMRWAKQGRDVYAYTSGGPRGTPCVWIERQRVSVKDWPAVYAEWRQRQQAKGGAQ